MPTTTTNYGYIKPAVNDPTDQDLWGGYLNTNFDDLDTDLKTIADDVAAIDLTNVAYKNVAQEYTKTQNFDATVLIDAASISWDLESNQVASVVLGGNRALATPTNMKAGATYILIVKQDVTGSRTLSYASEYKFPNGTSPVLTTTGGAVDILTFVSDGSSMYGAIQKAFS